MVDPNSCKIDSILSLTSHRCTPKIRLWEVPHRQTTGSGFRPRTGSGFEAVIPIGLGLELDHGKITRNRQS